MRQGTSGPIRWLHWFSSHLDRFRARLLHDSVGIVITFAAAGAGADALPCVVAVGDESGEAPPGGCRSDAAATAAVTSQISASVMIITVSRPPPAARTSAATAIFPIAHFPAAAAPSATAANNSRQTHERPYEPMFRSHTAAACR